MPESGQNPNNPLNTKQPAAASETTTFPPQSPESGRSATSSQGHELQPKKRHLWVWIFLLLLIIGGIIVYRVYQASAQATKSAANQGPHTIPVTTAVATKGDMGDYVTALATVVPVYTVTITGRVQGEIVAIHYNEGQLVKKGDPLIDIDPRPYQAQLVQTEGQLAHDQAVLDEARIDLARYQAAFSRNAIAKQQVDDQTQVVLQDEGTVKNDQGMVDAVKVNLVYTHIVSPIDGRVGLRLVDPGNIVQANSSTPLVVITQLQPITAIFSVSQKFLPQIETQLRQGQKMAVDVTDTEDKKLATGSVLTTDNQVDDTTSTIRLKAIFANSDLALFPQQFVNVRLQLGLEHNVTLVPTPAVQMNSQGSFVYVVNPDQTASTRTVKAGTAGGGMTVVQGVNPGDTVATNGFNNLQDGSKVHVQNGNSGGAGAPSSIGTGTPPPNSKSPKSGKRNGTGAGASNTNGGNHE